MSSAHELRLAVEGRRGALGAWYTPADVVDGVLHLALDPLLAARAAEGPDAVATLRVLDPACGSGAFLVNAAQRVARCLVGLGVADADARAVAARCLAGVDVDPDAADLARAALDDWTGIEPSTARVAIADALDMAPVGWLIGVPAAGSGAGLAASPTWDDLLEPSGAAVGFDLVVGNPPFLGQVRRATRREPTGVAAARQRARGAVAAFTDVAALFWALAGELARPDGGVVAMVLPVPLLATRDARPVRRQVLDGAVLRDLWVSEERSFSASVDVCAPVLVRHATGGSGLAGPTQIWRGRAFDRGPQATPPTAGSSTWSGLLATLAGLPERTLATVGRLGDLATGSADFRDQYYGLAGHVVDRIEAPGDGSQPPLVTVGSVDPAHLRWGEVHTRFQRMDYRHPRVMVEELDERLQAWAAERLVPKVMVATQTRVLEVVVDREGAMLPSVPLISLVPRSTDADDLDRIAAVLSSPPITLLAAHRHLGAARHVDALKLRVSEVLDLPLPADRKQWDVAAAAFRAATEATTNDERRGHLVECGRATIAAFGLGEDPELHHWWAARLPARC